MPYHVRQMAVLRREQRLDWLDGLVAEDELLHPLPAGSFRVREDRRAKPLQRALPSDLPLAFAAAQLSEGCYHTSEFARSLSTPPMAQLG